MGTEVSQRTVKHHVVIKIIRLQVFGLSITVTRARGSRESMPTAVRHGPPENYVSCRTHGMKRVAHPSAGLLKHLTSRSNSAEVLVNVTPWKANLAWKSTTSRSPFPYETP